MAGGYIPHPLKVVGELDHQSGTGIKGIGGSNKDAHIASSIYSGWVKFDGEFAEGCRGQTYSSEGAHSRDILAYLYKEGRGGDGWSGVVDIGDAEGNVGQGGGGGDGASEDDLLVADVDGAGETGCWHIIEQNVVAVLGAREGELGGEADGDVGPSGY